MAYCILTKKGTVISRKIVQILSNLEKDTYKGRARINEFESEIIWRFKEEDNLVYDWSKLSPEDWLE